MKKNALVLVAALACAACGTLPRDTEGTLDRVERDGRFRVGLIAPAGDAATVRRYLADVGAAAGAAPTVQAGAAEPLLLRLEQGDLDLVVGEMERKTPWTRRVFLLPPLASRHVGSSEVTLVPVARNGENRWIALLDQHARAVGGR